MLKIEKEVIKNNISCKEIIIFLLSLLPRGEPIKKISHGSKTPGTSSYCI